jgi:hypothetical protein
MENRDRIKLAEDYSEMISNSFMENATELVSDLENATYSAFLDGYDSKETVKWKKINSENIRDGYLYLHKDNYITELYTKEQNNLTHYITIDDLLNLEKE